MAAENKKRVETMKLICPGDYSVEDGSEKTLYDVSVALKPPEWNSMDESCKEMWEERFSPFFDSDQSRKDYLNQKVIWIDKK